MQLKWTTEPPSVPGWYWYKTCLGATIVNISTMHSGQFEQIDGWMWAGPIQEPIDNDTAEKGGENGACDQMGVDS